VAEAEQPHSTPRSRVLPVVRLDHLWILVALSAVGVLISLSQTVPNDFWWHMKIGQVIATEGLPDSNIFSWALPADASFVYQSWLGEWLFFVLYQVGGLPFVVFVRNILGLVGFGLVAVEAHRRSGSWRLASGALVLAVLMSLNNLTTRTQNWSWVPFGVLLLLLGSYSSGRLSPRWLVALPLLMIFWVNAHGAFMIGLLATGAFVVGETLRRLLRQPHALNWDRLKALYLAAAAMVAVTVINPLGVGVFAYVLTLLTDPPSQQLVIEWQPANPRSFAGRIFYGGVLLLIAAFAFARRRPTITDVILVCGFGWMAFSGVRYVMWFAMVAMPIVAQSLAPPRPVFVPGSSEQRPAARRTPAGNPTINLVLAGLLVLAVVLVQPWFKPALPLPETYVEFFAPVPGAPLLFSADTPVQATEYLRAEPCQGHLFNEMGYGSYLIWALYPQEKVFVDPRVELYPLEMWEDYIYISQGRNLNELLASYDIACVLLDKDEQPDLSQGLTRMPDWQRTYENEQSEVWRRRGSGG
jgi:hypothetical protein